MRRSLACTLTLFFMLPAAAASADHVTASPQVSARLAERVSDNAWAVVVDWSINCSGPAPGNANYTGSLNLDDVDTGAEIYMGGTSSASGSDRQPVSRGSSPRRMRPRLRASCFDGGPGKHGSETIEVTGNIVTVPAKGDEDGDGVPDPGPGGGAPTPPPPAPAPSLPGGAGDQGRRDFPGFGGPRDPLRSGGCARVKLGTKAAETLVGTVAADLIFGLEGNDVIRGGGHDDCLIGGSGRDRLLGGLGHDRLTGGTGADTLVGGAGTNRYDAGAGNDVVNARNRRAELVSCGSGRDLARVDRRDRVRRCERVQRR